MMIKARIERGEKRKLPTIDDLAEHLKNHGKTDLAEALVRERNKRFQKGEHNE